MSNLRKNKVKNGILYVVLLAFLIAIIGGTYANYSAKGTVTTSVDIAKWHVTLNGNTPLEQFQNFELNVTDAVVNENVVSGKLAPGKTLLASLEVNPSGSEVSIDYELEIGNILPTGFNSNSSLSVSKVLATLDGSSAVQLYEVNNTYRYSEQLSDVMSAKKVTFNIYITWDEQGTENGDIADTANIGNYTSITAPITITAKQHLSTDVATAIEDINVLGNLVSSVSEGGTVNIENNLDLSDYIRIDPNTPGNMMNFPDNAKLDLNGNTVITHNMAVSYQGNNLTIENGNFVALDNAAGSTNPGSYALFLWDNDNYSNNVTLRNITSNGGVNVYKAYNVVLENCNITATKFYAVYGNDETSITINSGTYSCSENSVALLGYYKEGNTADGFVINGGTFLTNGKPFYLINSTHIAPKVRGGVFDVDITTKGVTLEEGYTINQRADGMWEVTHN